MVSGWSLVFRYPLPLFFFDYLTPPDNKKHSSQNRITQIWQVQITPGYVMPQCDSRSSIGSQNFPLHQAMNCAVVLETMLGQSTRITLQNFSIENQPDSIVGLDGRHDARAVTRSQVTWLEMSESDGERWSDFKLRLVDESKSNGDAIGIVFFFHFCRFLWNYWIWNMFFTYYHFYSGKH